MGYIVYRVLTGAEPFMICEVCQTENATVHLTQIISGKMQKIDLCEKCAKEKGVADPAGFSLADMNCA